MRKLLLQSLVGAPLTEKAPAAEEEALAELAHQVDRTARRRLGRSLSIREVDAGSAWLRARDPCLTTRSRPGALGIRFVVAAMPMPS